MSEPDSRGKEGLFEEAAAWFARMRGPEADASRADFEKWLARGALHRAAYNRAAEVFAMGKILADDADEVLVTNSPAKRPSSRVVIGGVAAGLVFLVTAALLVVRPHPTGMGGPDSSGANSREPAQLAELAAPSGPQSIRLVDNSLVRLARGAHLAVQYANSERRLSLESGSARFFVAHEARPFIVYAGDASVVAHGTVFDVGLSSSSRVTVRLIEGIVDVNAPMGNGKDVRASLGHRRLHAGEMVSFTAAANSDAHDRSAQNASSLVANTAELTASTDDYDSITLGDLVRLANERNAKPIRLANSTTAELRVSGKFRIDNTDLLAQRIAGLFDLVVDRSNPAVVVLRGK